MAAACRDRNDARYQGQVVDMESGTGLFLSIAMLGVFALGAGGGWMLKRDRKRGLLMIGVALVLLANVLILVWPIRR